VLQPNGNQLGEMLAVVFDRDFKEQGAVFIDFKEFLAGQRNQPRQWTCIKK